MKIVYLHGLESNVDQKDPKIIFLNNNFDEVFTPSINYKDKNTFAKLFSKIKAINPDLIVGSSMGGYFAYLIGSKLSIETVLFNPAVVGRAFDPIVDDTNLSGVRHNIFLGKSDNVISGKDIKSYLNSNGVGNFKYRSYKGGHRVSEDTFINSIKNIAGIRENDSSQIYTKRKYIKMKHIKTPKSINEAKMPFSVEYFDMGEWFEYEYDGGYKSEKDAMEVAKEIADNSGDKVRILKNGKKVKSLNEGSTYRVYMNSDMDEPERIDYEIYFGDGTKAEMIKQAKKMVKSKTNQYGDPILVKVVHEDDIDDVAFTNESVNEGAPRADKALKDLEKQGSEIDYLDDANAATKKIWKNAGVNPDDENTIILYSYANGSWPETKKILKKHSVDFKELEDPNSAGESFIVFVKESVNESLTSNYRVHSKYVKTFESINQSKYTNLN